MRKSSLLILAAGLALAGIGTAPTIGSHAVAAPLPTINDSTDTAPARDVQPKAQAEQLAVQMRQVQAKGSTTYRRHSPKRRYHRQHWRRVAKGW